MGRQSWFVYTIVYPLLFAGTYLAMGAVWGLSGLMGKHYSSLAMSDMWSIQTALFVAGYSLIPMMMMVVTVMASRIFTKAGNTLMKDQSLTFQVHSFVLRNTLEQNVLFVLNILGAASFYG